MSPVAKRRRSGEYPVGNDLIISNLPAHLITCILDRMPTKDAARTSILSKTWKNIWISRCNVVLRYRFIHDLVSNQDEQSHQTLISQTVNNILLSHKGPMSKFCLFIPANIDLRPYYDSWMSILLTKRIQHLELINETKNPNYYIPSNFFSCSQLRELLLHNYRLDPPPNFRGFRSLTFVYLKHIIFDAPMSFGPQLKKLSLVQCAGIHHLGLQFTHDNKNLIKFELLRAEKLEIWYAILHGEDEISSMKECIDLYRFLSSTPNLATLVLDKVSLNFMDPRRSILMENMKTLVLYAVDFNDLEQISKLLNLIRSSPNLQTLKISVAPQAKKKDLKFEGNFVSQGCNIVDVWRQLIAKKKDLKVERYLASPECRKIVLSQLRSIEVGEAARTLAECFFIHLLRASSPSPRSLRLRWHYSPVSGLDIEELQ